MVEFKLSLTAIIIKDESLGIYTGTLKEIDGVIAQGASEDEVLAALPLVLGDLFESNREDNEFKLDNSSHAIVSERKLQFSSVS